jgi:hypothetical protein
MEFADLWDYTMTALSAIHALSYIADIVSANQMRQTHISCGKFCSNNRSNDLETQYCSDWIVCPNNPDLYHNLFVASTVFIFFPAFMGVVTMCRMRWEEENKEKIKETLLVRDCSSQIRVLRNCPGDPVAPVTLATFYLYATELAKSRVSTLQHFHDFDSKVQFLAQRRPLYPVYAFSHFLHFTVLSLSSPASAKVYYPNEILDDQETLTLEFQIVNSPTRKVTKVPAAVVLDDPLTARRFLCSVGIMIANLPQAIIQLVYLVQSNQNHGAVLFSAVISLLYALMTFVWKTVIWNLGTL